MISLVHISNSFDITGMYPVMTYIMVSLLDPPWGTLASLEVLESHPERVKFGDHWKPWSLIIQFKACIEHLKHLGMRRPDRKDASCCLHMC